MRFTDRSLKMKAKSGENRMTHQKLKNQDLAKIIDIIEKGEAISTTNSNNLTRNLRNALLELKNDKEIVIKKADKGNSLQAAKICKKSGSPSGLLSIISREQACMKHDNISPI